MFDFKSLRGVVQSVSEKHAQLCTQIQQLQTEIQQLRYAPANREDITSLVNQWVDACGQRINDVVQTGLNREFRNGGTSVQRVDAKPNDLAKFISGYDANLNGDDVSVLLCAALGPQIKQGIATAIKAANWPGEGLSSSKRAIEIQKMETKLSGLEQERHELEEEAIAAGINLR